MSARARRRPLALAAAAALAVPAAGGLAAQHVVVGPQVVFGDYREVSANLHFRGAGVGAAASLTWKDLSLDVSGTFIDYDPVDDPTGTLASFKATEFDARVRYYVGGPASVEIGIVSREMDPEFEAQSVGAVTAGGRIDYLLGPGVRMRGRAGLLFAPKFSGGGTASPIGAIELGLGFTVDALRGRLRLTADYDFQRIARTTHYGSGEVDVPIQQSLARVGVALVL
ncbi:MAG: hypothetical protein ACREMN_01775 [Gemmatimonadales bacterium]